jgi:O-acetyl-ADP-ribose deacetylase (regulator of RNase III)
MDGKIEVILGDITQQNTDAIVNAANTTLLGGGGVDGAIHRAAGPELLQECRRLGGCPTGQARITRGYRLPARYIIHTVGPVWQGGHKGEEDLLRACYLNSLKLAKQNGVRTMAFPSISTGAYRFPIEPAAKIAVVTIRQFLDKEDGLERVVLVCFSKNDLEAYRRELAPRERR